MTDRLEFRRYRFTARAEQTLRLPDFAGSMLRGAFGHALRGLSPMPHTGDEPCPSAATCPYCQIFSTPAPKLALQKFSHVPNPYVIEPPEIGARVVHSGETFDFNVVLIGKALAHLSVVVRAFDRALRQGLTAHNTRCKLMTVHVEGHDDPICTGPDNEITPQPNAQPLPEPMRVECVTLRFSTPLRLQHKGHPIGIRELDARTLLIALARRQQLLADINLEEPPQLDFGNLGEAARNIVLAQQLRWYDWTRYSGRQQREMTLGGLVGDITLSGDLVPFYDVLHAGQWLHAGKNATFGLGRYALIDQRKAT